MDEGAKDRERQAIVFDLFPLKKHSILTAFQEVTLENLDEEKRILSDENPYVFNSFEELTGYYTEVDAKQALLGILICHRALREEAKSRGGVLPKLTQQFVQSYDEKRERSAQNELIDKNLGKSQTGQQIRRATTVTFRNLAPEFSEIVEEKFRGQHSMRWRPEDGLRYLGIINTYLLFKEGCSDPKNFAKNSLIL